MSINNILRNFNNFLFSDDSVLEKIQQTLIPVYYDNKKDNLSNKRDPFSIMAKYKSDFRCPIPWIDTETWNIFSSRTEFLYPKKIRSDRVSFTSKERVLSIGSKQRREFSREAAESTRQCIKSYTTRSRRLHSYERNLLGRAGLEAAKKLKIFGLGTNTLRGSSGRIQSVLDTAKNTNSGYPFYKSKNSDSCVKDTINWMDSIFNKPTLYSLMKNPLMDLPISLFYRVQPSVEDEINEIIIKIRQVWGLPQRLIALEYYFFHGILENVYLNNKFSDNCIYSSGLTNFDISIKLVSKLRKQMQNTDNNYSLYSMDYSKFDRNVPSFAIDLFYSICSEELNFNNQGEEKLFYLLRFYIKHSPFCYKQKLYFRTNGIPSGSYITNLIDTWWNLTLWIYSDYITEYYLTDVSSFLNKKDLFSAEIFDNIIKKLGNINFNKCIAICGDDTAILTNSIHIHIMKEICKSFNMELTENVVSKDSKEPIFFLGRYWDLENRPIQSDLYMFGHIVVRTKFYKKDEVNFDISKFLTIMRLLSITLQFSNGKDFLIRFFSEFKKLNDYLNVSTGFYLLKDYPLRDTYKFVNQIDAMSWERM